MKIFIYVILFFGFLNAAFVKEATWDRGESLITFLDKYQIQKDIYFNLSKTDKELCSEIYAGVEYQILFDEQNKILQVLIPISEEMQIHIFKDSLSSYSLDIIPIEYEEYEETSYIAINNSPYKDILEATSNKELANEFMLAFKKSVNFRKLQKDDVITIKYKQKIRMGRYFGTPDILGASVSVRGKNYFIFENQKDNKYYDENGKSLTSVYFKVPLQYNRISSRFTYKRYHPILKKYRAHLGVDFAAPTGRKVFATAEGKVIHVGLKGGYGKTIIIRHANGYKSLYAHLNSYSARIKSGSWVKQGTFIGRVGSTGRSTGPHLHFGMYKNGRAVDPQKVISTAKTVLKGSEKQNYLKYVKNIKTELLAVVDSKQKSRKIEPFESSYKIQ